MTKIWENRVASVSARTARLRTALHRPLAGTASVYRVGGATGDSDEAYGEATRAQNFSSKENDFRPPPSKRL